MELLQHPKPQRRNSWIGFSLEEFLLRGLGGCKAGMGGGLEPIRRTGEAKGAQKKKKVKAP